jgi:hypothetical protein
MTPLQVCSLLLLTPLCGEGLAQTAHTSAAVTIDLGASWRHNERQTQHAPMPAAFCSTQTHCCLEPACLPGVLTKLDKGVGPRDTVHLAAIQLAELPRKLLQVLEGQLLGVALLSEGQEAGVA